MDPPLLDSIWRSKGFLLNCIWRPLLTSYFYMAIYTNDRWHFFQIKSCSFTLSWCPTFEGDALLRWSPQLWTNFPPSPKNSCYFNSMIQWSLIPDGHMYVVAVLCQSKHLVSFPTFEGAFVLGWFPTLSRSTPHSPPEIMICVNWAFVDWFCGNRDCQWRLSLFVSNYLKKSSSEKSHSQIGRWHFHSCALSSWSRSWRTGVEGVNHLSQVRS